MKKLISLLLAIVTALSLLTLSGCKKKSESLTDAELFKNALCQLFYPEIFEKLSVEQQLQRANHTSLSLDRLAISLPESFGGTSADTAFPSFGIELFKFDDEHLALSGNVELDGDVLDGRVELCDGEQLYLSIPSATDRYITCTLDSLAELMEDSGDISREQLHDIADSVSAFAKAVEAVDELILNDDRLSRDTEYVEVFGEEQRLDRLTLTLDESLAPELLEYFADVLGDSLPEDTLDSDELEELINDEGISLELTLSIFLDGDELRRCEMELDAEIDGERDSESLGVSFEADVENTSKGFKSIGELTLLANDDEVLSAEFDSELALNKNGLTGEAHLVPTVTASSSDGTTTQSFEISTELDGVLERDSFDIDIECELSLGAFSIKLPIELCGTFDKEHIDAELSLSTSFMGVGFEFKASALAEDTDLEAVEYDSELAVELDDNDGLREFATDVADYVDGLDSLGEFLSRILSSAETLPLEPDYDNDYFYDFDDDYYNDYFDDYFDDDFYYFDDDSDYDFDYFDDDDFYDPDEPYYRYDDFGDFDFDVFDDVFTPLQYA